jgi:hypothetical protein
VPRSPSFFATLPFFQPWGSLRNVLLGRRSAASSEWESIVEAVANDEMAQEVELQESEDEGPVVVEPIVDSFK